MFYSPATSRGGGDRSGRHGGCFVVMNNVSDSAIDTPFDRSLFFVEFFDFDLFAARVESRGWETLYRVRFILDGIGSLLNW